MTPTSVRGKRVTVLGAARSGLAVSFLLHGAGAHILLSEYKAIPSDTQARLQEAGVAFEDGGHSARAADADFVVISPGIPATVPFVRDLVQRGIPLYSEIETASWFCRAPIVAITGSNGKTTTTSLIGHVFRQAGRRVFVAGNIGQAFAAIARQTTASDIVVLEVSSFQLDHIETFRPRVSVLLNVTPDHLDRYDHRFENYAASKFRIFERQAAGDTFVYNADDPVVLGGIAKSAHLRHVHTLGISQLQELRDGAFLRDGRIVIRLNHEEEILMRKEELALQGPHNVYNSLAAAVAARVMEIPSPAVRESLSTFEGVPHRLEFVRELDGVRYVNDSKATNVNAVWYALESFSEKIVLIAGGRDKGNDYSSLEPLVRRNVRVVIALGESAEKVETELGAHAEQHMSVSSLEKAVQAAHLLAQPGEVVLLSPACASFDMFDNYEHRGNVFRELVMNL